MKHETTVRTALETLKSDQPTSKDDVRAVMAVHKRTNIMANLGDLQARERACIDLMRRVDYANVDPTLVPCSPKQRPVWLWYRHIVHSAPYRGRPGRVMLFFVIDRTTGGVLGLVELGSDLTILGPRDVHIGWTRERKFGQRAINHCVNVGTCVSVQPFGTLIGGKFQIVASTSTEVVRAWEAKYRDQVVAVGTTSLFGKSSIYNRIKEFPYLGMTKGEGIFHISDQVWETMLQFMVDNRLSARKTAIGGRMEVLHKICGVLKIDVAQFSSHQPRGVYFSELAPNTCAFLRGDDATCSPVLRSSAEIAEAWRDRWYTKRLKTHGAEAAAFDWRSYTVAAQIDWCNAIIGERA